MDLIQPKLKDDALLRDIFSARHAGDKSFNLWWLGQSGFLLQWKGRHLLFDPYLSDSLTNKYAATDKPHVRMTELVIQPGKLDFIDVVTSSHNHTDHLDGETLIPLLKANPDIAFIIPEANRDFVAERAHCPRDFPTGLNDGQSATIGEFTFTGIPAAHNELERDDYGRCRYMGYVVEFGPWAVYHSGDTLWHEDILLALEPFSIDLALLPINGNKPERRVAGNLDAREAVAMAQAIRARMVIPCHYDMFTFNTADPAEFVLEAQRVGQAFEVMACGGRWSSSVL